MDPRRSYPARSRPLIRRAGILRIIGRMCVQNEAVTVRLLHAGEPGAGRSGHLENREGRRLTVSLTADNAADDLNTDDLKTGAVVEVECEHFLFLGEILGRQSSRLIIAVEHAVNRAALAEIQDVWHVPQQA